MSREERFDSFYRSTRRDLVLQTFALTGDLRAAQGAVRDAYVAAWHHWRKVDPRGGDVAESTAWVRTRAWALAQRRHTARLFRRNRDLSEQDGATLEALAALSLPQRRTLLLTQLVGVSLTEAARETGVPGDTAERQLQQATANFSVALDADSAAVRARLLGLSGAAERATLPRASIVRRAGTKRRRVHTVLAAAAATLVAVASGAFAYQPDSVQAATDLNLVVPSGDAPAPADPLATAPVDAAEQQITGEQLLDADQISRLGSGQDWQVEATHDNTAGDGINTICQQARFADPDGRAALVREFRAEGTPRRSAVQTVEVSDSEAQAKRAFATTVQWYAGCQLARLQLLKAYRVDHIGDQAHVLVLRVWDRPVTTYTVAVARIGQVTTSTVGRTVGAPAPPPSEVAQSLDDAVSMLCARSGADSCGAHPSYAAVPPPPSGEEPGILAVVDLPPVGRVDQPWVGTEAGPARDNPSATTCDRADFSAAGAERTRTRTFLIPEANLPDRFGLSETYGVFPSAKRADRFVRTLRHRLDSCEDRKLATHVLHARSDTDREHATEWSTWVLRTEVTDRETVTFRMGLVRVGDRVAQVTFAPAPHQDMTGQRFRNLVQRAGDRLRELPDDRS
jgi:DNA-directed RNA polymerase specialized sigma24 family protein